MDVSLQELAEVAGGTLEGDGSVRIRRAAPLGEATCGDITFVAQKKYEALAQQTGASAVIVSQDFGSAPKPLIRVRDPLASFLAICSRLVTPKPRLRIGVHAQAHVAATARLGSDVNVFPGASIGEGTVLGDRVDVYPGVCIGDNCRIGSDVVLHPNVVLYDDTVLGDRVTIHSGSVIGSDGFGYRPKPDGHPVKVPQLGSVEIGDDVEIGACTTVDRATFGTTRVGSGTKIDNLVMIAHNCQVGKDCLIVSHVGVAGSSKIGDRVVLAGQVGIVDHVEIGDGAVVGAQAGVTKDVAPGETVFGSPAGPALETKRMLLALTRLPEYRSRIRDLEKRLAALESKQEGDQR